MNFKDGEESDVLCPKCQKPMIFEMSFKDCFSYQSGHYTTDRQILVCNDCDEVKDLEDEE